MFWRSLPTRATWKSVCEIGSESLLHRKIWRTNPLLGYMHTSFALGWFLLILTGWIETLVYFKGHNVPLYVDIFFSYYVHPIFERNFNFSLIKDALLLLILIGIGWPFSNGSARGQWACDARQACARGPHRTHRPGGSSFRPVCWPRVSPAAYCGNSVASAGLWATRCTLSRRESAAAVS